MYKCIPYPATSIWILACRFTTTPYNRVNILFKHSSCLMHIRYSSPCYRANHTAIAGVESIKTFVLPLNTAINYEKFSHSSGNKGLFNQLWTKPDWQTASNSCCMYYLSVKLTMCKSVITLQFFFNAWIAWKSMIGYFYNSTS